jgi:hypothetical protein
MDPNTKIKFSRNGVEIGQENLKDVKEKLKLGIIKHTDYYWHEGMTQWAPIQFLLEAIERAEEKERITKENEKIAKAKKDEEIAKAKRDEQVAKAIKAENEKRNNYFKCNCCRINFEKSEGLGERFTRGIVFILFSYIFGFAALIALGRQNEDGFFSFFGALLVLGLALLFIVGIGFVLAAFVRSPSCPGCGSSNFAKPEKLEPLSKQ